VTTQTTTGLDYQYLFETKGKKGMTWDLKKDMRKNQEEDGNRKKMGIRRKMGIRSEAGD
jgi:hypothetical protein